jgi:hypothetical protein
MREVYRERARCEGRGKREEGRGKREEKTRAVTRRDCGKTSVYQFSVLSCQL